jgi:hypothetical protein
VPLGAGDCERLRDGLVAQPVNTASALAYLLAAAWLARQGARQEAAARRETLAFGLAVAAAGVGSVDFHGPGSPAARWLHDAGLAAAVSFVAVHDLTRLAAGGVRGTPRTRGAPPPASPPTRCPGRSGRRLAVPAWAATAGAALALLAVAPAAGGALAGALGLLVAAGEVALWRRGDRGARVAAATSRGDRGADAAAYRAGVAALAVGAACWWLGRTGGPLCDPDSPLQGHAAWHLLTAFALAAWGRAVLLGGTPQARS